MTAKQQQQWSRILGLITNPPFRAQRHRHSDAKIAFFQMHVAKLAQNAKKARQEYNCQRLNDFRHLKRSQTTCYTNTYIHSTGEYFAGASQVTFGLTELAVPDAHRQTDVAMYG